MIEALLGDPKVSATKSGNNSGDDKKCGGAREWVKIQIESFITIIRCKLADKALAAVPCRNHRFNNFIDFEQSKVGDRFVITEFVGTYHRCRSFDLHIFDDENEKKINHVNIHHTVKTAVIPNIKAAFSSS